MTSDNQKEEYTEVLSRNETAAPDENIGRRAFESYNYMKAGNYRKQLKISPVNRKKGTELVNSSQIKIDNVRSGYLSESYERAYKFEATGTELRKKNRNDFAVSMMVTRDRVVDVYCNCPQCNGYYYYWHKRDYCPYVSGLIDLIEDYFEKNNTADATDMAGDNLINAFRGRKKSQIISDNHDLNQSLNLEPKLIRRDGQLGLGFRVGSGKLFVIKDLAHFADNVKKSATDIYGSDTSINHGIQNFKPEAQKWIQFIFDAVTEEDKIYEKVMEKSWRQPKMAKLGQIELYGWRVDRFFDDMSGESIRFEDRDEGKKYVITTSCEDPKLTLSISPETEQNIFQGIRCSMDMPVIYDGTGSSYYIDERKCTFNRMSNDFHDKLSPLFDSSFGGMVKFVVGRRNLADFYYNILPEIEEKINVEEHDTETIEQYLSPEAQFSFYLDAPQKDVTCRINVRYGDREYSALDQYRGEMRTGSGRSDFREQEVLLLLQGMFPEKDLENDILSCGGDDDLMYSVVSHGVEELAEIGDVYCTNRFKRVNSMRKPNVSIGVSVSEGLLNLDIQTGDISEEELLDLLKNYRSRQKYFRFKSGEYADLSDDSLQMLFEMMETMHLSPKDFVKGKMNLPIYRTLYLDKMLEEHEEICNTRDQVFREIVKNMKSVNDSDYDVPESLQKVMRKYQKTGFRWLRTLEACKFGGILADDMGLGKTLQIISVLLSAKEEGRKGTSLVVSPASLVFNWGEEFARFAPSLKVTLVTGKQEERAEMIDDYESSDVLVTSYDLLKRDIDLYEGKKFLYEIIDEAQYIKNQTTAASKSVKVITAASKFALTGTPIENRLSELWSIFDYLMPGFLYGYEVFKKEFETPIVKNGDEKALKRLQKMVSPFILRRLKGDVLKDLPDKLEETRTVRFDDEQQKLYDAQLLHMKKEIASGSETDFNRNKLQILAEITRLRQICCDPHLCFDNYNGDSAKLESCIDLIKSAIEGGHKILLFSQFTSMLAIIEKRLSAEEILYYKITGETGKQDRLEMVKKFNGDDTPVFLISLKAGGVGLNLTGADVVIHYDPWWNVAVQNQATDRAHRIGQTRKVTVYKMITKGTIEERIIKLQESKRDLADSIINGDSSGMGGMSREELMELLGID